MASLSIDSMFKLIVLLTTGLSVVHSVALRHIADNFDWNKSMEKGNVEIGGKSSLQFKNARMFPFVDSNSNKRSTSVDHFALHGLCNHEDGKHHFYRALKSELCQINDSFAATLVEDLCKEKERYMRNKWVGELFDTDGDGYITHYERRHYQYDD